MKSFFLLFGTIILIVSCTYNSFTPLNPSLKYPAVEADEVILYLYEKDIPKDYEKLGLVRLSGLKTEDALMKEARKKAGEIGANGLYYKGFEYGYNYRQIVGDSIVTHSVGGNVLIAIRTN